MASVLVTSCGAQSGPGPLVPGGTAAVAPQPAVALEPAPIGDSALASLEVSLGPLQPGFSPERHRYTVDGLNRLSPIQVKAVARDASARVTVNGRPVRDGAVELTLAPEEDLAIEVQARGAAPVVSTVELAPRGIPAFSVWSAGPPERGTVLLTPGFSSLLAVDRQGQVRFARNMAPFGVFDFKQHRLPEAEPLYSYIRTDATGATPAQAHLLDARFDEVGVVQVLPHGAHGALDNDIHDFLVLGHEHYVAVAYWLRTVDLSTVVPGGSAQENVDAAVVQEIDHGQVVFEWDSTSVPQLYLDSTDGNAFGTPGFRDYVHLNSVTIDPFDGNFVISLRHTDSVLKVSRATGALLWTLGGRSDGFGLAEAQRFSHQHFARYDPDHRLVLFDNGNGLHPSRALAFTLDEVEHRVTGFEVLFEKPQDQPQTTFMGSVSVLGPGRALIGWGGWIPGDVAPPSVTEVADGAPVWALTFASPTVFSYRAMPAL